MTATTTLAFDGTILNAISAALPLLVLSGAGISAGTGIPTYRDAEGKWLRSDPITHQEFLRDPRQRKRYWGRSQLGWPAVRDARPADAHRHLAALEATGLVSWIVTQNVDRLHQRAGSENVTDLHGRLDRVCCLDCDQTVSRDHMQRLLEQRNPHINRGSIDARPDGDADMSDELVDSVDVPSCSRCEGTLMPDVVFFGGSIPAQQVLEGKRALERSNGLLVVGSSLQVYSGYRFCKWAAQSGKPIFIMNPGVTRADALASYKWPVDADTGVAALRVHLEQTTISAARQESPESL